MSQNGQARAIHKIVRTARRQPRDAHKAQEMAPGKCLKTSAMTATRSPGCGLAAQAGRIRASWVNTSKLSGRATATSVMPA